MDDLARRIAELPVESRSRLAKLLKGRGPADLPARPAAPPPQGQATLLELNGPLELSGIKASYKQFYDSVTVQLNASMFGRVSFFLNYGYLPDGSPEYAVVPLPEHFINRNSVKLVLELIGDCPVNGKRVLDVGCGRGGTIYTLKAFFQPATLTGLDLSSQAIEFDKEQHGDERTFFHEGDAETLPFADRSFDILTNVESSHSYPNIHRFYSEVFRVLEPGGYFLYTDALAPQRITAMLAYLDYLGFALEHNRNITRNVLLSCDAVSQTRVEAFDSRNNQQVMQNFLAIPGSEVYEEMRTGRWEYRIYRFRKRA